MREQKRPSEPETPSEKPSKQTSGQKSQERGWYRVEGILEHRVVRVKNRDRIELRVKWADYEETTWEAFCSFVKDTAPMVERYLTKKSLIKPLHAYSELKRVKSLELDANDPFTAAAIKQFKTQFAGLEHLFLLPAPEKNGNGDTKSTTIGPKTMAATPTRASPATNRQKTIVKEVCCCTMSHKDE